GGSSVEKIRSLVGRLTYGYKGRYYATVSFRRDGSSVFAPGRQTENFPAAAVGWTISEEPFLQGSSLSLLKVRASYGRTGNAGPGPYSFQELIIQDFGATFGGGAQPAIAFTTTIGNRDLQWETTDMLNLGLDVGFLNNRLNFSVEYYDRQVDNLILGITSRPSAGNLGTTANIGAMSNSGIEFQGQYFSNASQPFKWNVSLNLSANTNEVERLVSEGQEIFGGRNFDAYTGDFDATITRVGDPIGSFYGFRTLGIFQSDAEVAEAPTQENAAPGDIRFEDVDGDGVITADDRVILGSYIPDFVYGVNFNATYNNFDFRLFFQGVQGNDVYNGLRSLSTQTVRLFNGSSDLLDSWTPQNNGAQLPAIRAEDPNNNRRMSDRFLEDGSYLRLKNITIGYRLPLNSSTISDLRFYVTGQNLITLTGYSGLDPEISGGNLDTGFDNGDYPQPRSFLFGVQAGF
ncbi:MAG: SusC/RagA family TonB-linked outer membrane protein, partial [Bacteroidota bacterium]